MRSRIACSVCGLILVLSAARLDRAAGMQGKVDDRVPKEVRALVGTYTGSWTMFGIDDQGNVKRQMAWTDTMKAENPEVKGDRASVATTDEMTFEGSNAPPFKIRAREGYFLANDGTVQDYFIENFGQIFRMVKVGDNVW